MQQRVESEVVYVDRCFVDTVVTFEADTASLQALLECDSLGNVLMSELETLQGQRVSVAPRIIYRNVVDQSGNIRRGAYLSVVAMADSLQREISVLEEQIRSEKKSDVREERRNPVKIFIVGALIGFLLGIISVILLKR